jgi:hypothetical protein
MKPRDLFGLAVRILGLVFLYLGLKDLPMLLDVPALMSGDKSDIIAAVLPVAFNLAVACWLLRSSVFLRWAYPETPKIQEHFHPPVERAASAAQTAQPQSKDLDTAEKKLASLLAKPKDDRAG